MGISLETMRRAAERDKRESGCIGLAIAVFFLGFGVLRLVGGTIYCAQSLGMFALPEVDQSIAVFFIGRQQSDQRRQSANVFGQLIEAYRRVETIERVTSWLFQVARNKIADSYRRHQTETLPTLEELLSDVSDGPEELFIRDSIWEEIVVAVEELPPAHREVFIGHELEGMSFRRMSELTGETENTLRLRKHYAMRALRQRLEALYREI